MTTGYDHTVPNSLPGREAIGEFKVLGANFPAEYGRTAGSVLNVVYKSGTNDFHGSVLYNFEGSSLETIKHMVASGMGVTVVPQLSVQPENQPLVRYVAFAEPVPSRRVVLAWRRSFTRYEAIAALRNAVYACKLEGVTRLS